MIASLVAWMDGESANRVALTLMHFLWQGAFIAFLLWAVGLILRNRTANARYLAFLAGQLVMVACAAVTFTLVDAPPREEDEELFGAASVAGDVGREDARATVRPPSVIESATALPPVQFASGAGEVDRTEPEVGSVSQDVAASLSDGQSLTIHRLWQQATPLIVAAYGLGVLVLLGRLLLGLRGGWKLRRHSELVDDASLCGLLAGRAQALGMRVSPALCRCRDIAVPTVVGILRPTILLPMSLAAGLTPDQLEAVLTHELAHIRRYDHLVNIVQRVIEALLFFHPAVWWISRRIRIEREHCCDDVVLRLGAEPIRYAELLVEIAENDQRSRTVRDVSLVAALQATDGRSQVSQRVRRLLGVPVTQTFRLSRAGVVSVFVIGAVLLCMLTSMQVADKSMATDAAGPFKDEGSDVANAKSPREAVAAFLKLIKQGASEKPFALTMPNSHVGWSKAFTGLKRFGSIRPLHQLSDEKKAIVVSNVYADDSGRDEVFTAVLQKLDGRWLIERHFRSKPEEAFLLVEGFKTNSNVRFDLIPDELVGRWEVNVCQCTVMLKADGTGSRLPTGPGGPAAEAVAESIQWSVKGEGLTIKSRNSEETLQVQSIDVGSLKLVAVGGGSGQSWAQSGRDPNVLPAKTIRIDSKQPFLNLTTRRRYAAPDGIKIEPPAFRNEVEPGEPNELQRWAGKNGVTLGLVEIDGKPYLQFFGQHAYPIHDPQQAAYYWNTRTASEVREAFRKGGFGMLPFEAFFQVELGKGKLPQTWQLPSQGLLRVDEFTGGDNPTVALQVKLVTDVNADSADEATGVARRRYFVCLVVGEEKLTFEGQETTWEQLPNFLNNVPNREQTVFEFAVSSEDLTIKQLRDVTNRCSQFGRQFGFEYPSYTGVKPLGSKGSATQDLSADGKQVQSKDEAVDFGSIAGRVVDSTGQAVAGVFVAVCDQKTGMPLSSGFELLGPEHIARSPSPELAHAVTDDDGRFEMTNVPAGEYRLIAQSWNGAPPNAKLNAVMTADVQIRGVAERVRVARAQPAIVVIRPLGDGILRLDDNINMPGVIVAISKSPPRADPVLGFVGWSGRFAATSIGACVKPAGKLTISGLPSGNIYVALCGMTANDESGFGVAHAEIQANATTDLLVPIMSSWAENSPGAPERLKPLIEKITATGSRAFFKELLRINRLTWDERAQPTTGMWYYWEQISRYLSTEVEFPGGGKANFGDVMAAYHYVAMSMRGDQTQDVSADGEPVPKAADPATGEEARADNVPWGEATDGVQVRLRPAKTGWRDDETATFNLDLQNLRDEVIRERRAVDFCELEVGGTWYQCVRSNQLRHFTEVAAKQQMDAWLSLTLADAWVKKYADRPGSRRTLDSDRFLQLTPGDHKIRAAFHFRSNPGPASGVRVLSKPLSITVAPIETKWGPSQDGLQVRLRPERLRWTIGKSPAFVIDLRNDGDRLFHYIRSAEIQCQVEFGGQWYRWGRDAHYDGPIQQLYRGQRLLSLMRFTLDGWESTKDRTALSLTPGTHAVRISFSHEGQPQAMSDFVKIEIADGTAANWGKAVDGVQVSLRAEKTKWTADEAPRLLADIRNVGKTVPLIGTSQEAHKVEIDGEWFEWRAAMVRVLHGGIEPGEALRIPFTLVRNWRPSAEPQGEGLPLSQQSLPLKPGEHTIRVAVGNAISNKVEIEVVARDNAVNDNAESNQAQPFGPAVELAVSESPRAIAGKVRSCRKIPMASSSG